MENSKAEHVISTLCELETANALELRVFRKEISVAQARSSWAAFESDLRQQVFQLHALMEGAFARAHVLSRQNTAKLGTGTADLLHVAAAIDLRSTHLYTFDQQQRKLAQTVRLKLN
jgi:cell division FtsZ-interacting protein ZapD